MRTIGRHSRLAIDGIAGVDGAAYAQERFTGLDVHRHAIVEHRFHRYHVGHLLVISVHIVDAEILFALDAGQIVQCHHLRTVLALVVSI
jgi:hypothetical protein